MIFLIRKVVQLFKMMALTEIHQSCSPKFTS